MGGEMWEDVQSPTSGDYLERIKVPGGWLYRCYFSDDRGEPQTMAMTFVSEHPSKK